MSEGSDYEVGYGKPPKQHRFKAGKSGNPRGRPKGATGFKADLAAAMGMTIAIKENGRSQRITVVAAALRRLIQKAVSGGELRAIERLLALAQQHDATAPTEVAVLAPEDKALLESFVKRQLPSADHD